MQAKPTPYTDINTLLEILLSGMQSILGPKLVGVYLYGSLVTGDFDRDSSDIDLVTVTSSDIDEGEFNALLAMHTDFATQHSEWDGRIEVAYISTHALKTYKTQTSQIAVISPGEPFHLKEAGIDWLINWYTIREKGVTLFGPSPKTLIDPIAKDEYLLAVRDHAQYWRKWPSSISQQRPSQAYGILTLCRAMYTLAKGELTSKKQAALWAEKEFPQWASLVQNALLWRQAWRDQNVDHDATWPETLRFVNFAIDYCEQYEIP